MVFKIPYVTVQPYMFLSSFVMTLHDIMLPQILLDTNCRIKYNTTICENINSPSFVIEQYHIQKQSALWLTAVQSFQGVLSTVIVLFLGPFADVIGTRRAMFLTPVCTGVQYIICSLLTSLAYPFDPRLLLLIAFIISLCGYLSGHFLFATSYVAAVTLQKERTFQIVILDMFYSGAVCLASFTSGYILENLGFTWAYLICLILSVLNGLFVLLFVEDLDTNAEVVSSDRKGRESNEQVQQKHCNNKDSSKRDLCCDIDSQVVSKADKQVDHNHTDNGKGYQSCGVSSELKSNKREVSNEPTPCSDEDNKNDCFGDHSEMENSKNCKEVVGIEVIEDSATNDISDACSNEDNQNDSFGDHSETGNSKNCKEVVGIEVIEDSATNDISDACSNEDNRNDSFGDHSEMKNSKNCKEVVGIEVIEESATNDISDACSNEDNKNDIFGDHSEMENSKNCKEVVGIEVTEDSATNDTSNDDTDATEQINTDPGCTSRNVKLFFIQVNPFSQFKLLFRLLREQNQTKIVFLLLIASFVSIITYIGEYNIIVLFIRNHPFDFDSVDVGYFIAFQNLIAAIVGGLVMNVLFQRCFVLSDMIAITFALTSHGLYLILLGLSTSKSMLYSIQILLAVGALDYPILRSALTKSANSGTQATLLSAIATAEQLGFLCAGLTGPVVYAEFLSLHRGAVFFFLSIFPMLASIATGIYFWKEKYLEKKTAQDDL